MFDALGVGGGASLIGGVAVLMAPVPFIFYKYGEPIRRRSKFAPTPYKEEHAPEPTVREQDAEGISRDGNTTGNTTGNDPLKKADDMGETDAGQPDLGAGNIQDSEKDLEKGEV
jgi:DHA1 family multidrug resistance protein-like MFS transporter